MKVQLRRFVTIGLMSGSLAISAIAGGAVVGAAAPNGTSSGAAVSTDAPKSRIHEERDYATSATATTDRIVTITATNGATVATTTVQVFNDDRRN